MSLSFRYLILCAAIGSMAAMAHAQTASKSQTPARDTVIFNSNGYATVKKGQTPGDKSFTDKEKIVREDFQKRELQKQRDQRDLPPLRTVQDGPTTNY